MSMWTALMIIAVVSIIAGTIAKVKENKGSDEAMAALDEMKSKIDSMESNLRERVETLERIVTDEKQDLKRKFDVL